MKKVVFVGLLILFAFFSLSFVRVSAGYSAEKKSEEKSALWPEIQPFKEDYLKVSALHEIYFSLSGNKDGKPVFYLHGGPGGGTSPRVRRYFNPEKFFIVTHDQRGAGQSRPRAEIRDNNTQNLVEDIEKLRKHLGLGKIMLVGGSWGSTLALAYAETYPENVSGIVLRGVFTGMKEEIDHFYHGGTRAFFPDVYDELINSLPDPKKRPLPDYLLQLLQSKDPEIRKGYARAWARYEGKLAFLEAKYDVIDGWLQRFDPYDFALLENYYMSNACFLKEGQLLQNADRIKNIPMTIVQGRYDVICPLITAYRLHQKLPKSKLIIVERAGHTDSEDPLLSALIGAIREFE